jgi:ribosome-associated protein
MADSKTKRPPIPASTRKRSLGAPKPGASKLASKAGASKAGAAKKPPARAGEAPARARRSAVPAEPSAPARLARAAAKAGAKGPRKTTPRADVPGPTEEARSIALAAAGAGLEKKAVGVEILDVTGRVDYADFLVVMTGRSTRQVDAIAQAIVEEVERKQKRRVLAVEGLPAAVWVLIDFGDVVVHVFQEEARTLYDIEGLWLDAKRLPAPGGGAGEADT